MKSKKGNLITLALGAASVGIAAAALAKGIPLLRAKLLAKPVEKNQKSGKVVKRKSRAVKATKRKTK